MPVVRTLFYALIAVLVVSATPAMAKKAVAKAGPKANPVMESYFKGIEATAANKFDEGISLLTPVIEAPKVSIDIKADALVNRGSCYAGKKMDDKAMVDFDQALSIKPSLDTAYYNRARSLAGQNKHNDAIADYTKAIDLSKSTWDEAMAYFNRGISYGALEKYDLAKADLKKAKDIIPSLVIPDHYQK